MINVSDNTNKTIITLTPNRSASWAQTRLLMFAIVMFVMLIATAWSFVGAWIILPFAGLEVGLLVMIMYRVSRITYEAEILTIDQHQVEWQRVRQPFKKILQQQVFSRDTLHIDIAETDNHWRLPEIRLITPQRKLLLGTFLNLSDREKFADVLRQTGIPNCRTHWWKN